MVITTLDAGTFNPSPLTTEQVLKGNPIARSAFISKTDDGLLSTWIWDCTAGQFNWTFWFDEIIHVLEGEARVKAPDGSLHILKPGVVVFFPRGLKTEWTVDTYIKKLAVHRYPRESRFRKLVSTIITALRLKF